MFLPIGSGRRCCRSLTPNCSASNQAFLYLCLSCELNGICLGLFSLRHHAALLPHTAEHRRRLGRTRHNHQQGLRTTQLATPRAAPRLQGQEKGFEAPGRARSRLQHPPWLCFCSSEESLVCSLLHGSTEHASVATTQHSPGAHLQL